MLIDTIDDFWDAFDDADAAGRLDLAVDWVGKLEGFDRKSGFELVNRLYADLAGTDLLAERVDEVIDVLETLPEAYPTVERHIGPWLRARRIDFWLQAGSQPSAEAVAEVIDTMETAPDAVTTAITRMLYHGLGRDLADAMLARWPDLESSDALMPWALRRFAWRAMTLGIIQEVDANPELTPDDKVLWERLEPLTVPDQRETNERLIGHFAGRPDRPVRGDDLEGLDLEELRDAAMMLVAEFTRELVSEYGWTPGRTALGFTVLDEYLRRVLTDRNEEERRYDRPVDGPEAESLAAALGEAPPVVLHPGEFAAYIEEVFSDLLISPYQGVTLLQMVGPWTEFLVDRGMLDADAARSIRRRVHANSEHLAERLEASDNDPILAGNLREARRGLTS